MAFSALAAIVRTAGICTVAVLPAYRPWSSGLFIGVWSALGCFDTGANFLARASEPTPASCNFSIRVAARASLGVALSIIYHVISLWRTDRRRRRAERRPNSTGEAFICGVLPLLLCDIQEALFPPEYVVYPGVGCSIVFSSRGMLLLTVIPRILLGALGVVLALVMWRRAPQGKRRRGRRHYHKMLVGVGGTEALVVLVSAAVMLGSLSNVRPGADDPQGGSTPGGWPTDQTRRASILSPIIGWLVFSVLFVVGSLFTTDVPGGYRAILRALAGPLSSNDGRNPFRSGIQETDAVSLEVQSYSWGLPVPDGSGSNMEDAAPSGWLQEGRSSDLTTPARVMLRGECR